MKAGNLRAMRWALPMAVLTSLTLATHAQADYQSAYRRGLEAVQRRAWADAAREMRAAISEKPAEGEQIKLYGMRFETYLPHYYLGLALFGAGDCAQALEAWLDSETQGAVKGRSEYKDLRRNRVTCETRLAEARPTPPPAPAAPRVNPAQVAQAVETAQSEISRAEEAGRGLGPLQNAAELASQWSEDSALGGSQRQANDALAAARERLAAGQRISDLAVLREAQDSAARARQLYESARATAAARLEQAQARASVPAPMPTAAAASSASKPALAPELLAGASAYFSGRYRDAVDALSRVRGDDSRTRAQVLLLRSAARHALYMLSEQKDATLRQAALDDARACRRLDPRTLPSPRAFSPAFLSFFSGPL